MDAEMKFTVGQNVRLIIDGREGVIDSIRENFDYPYMVRFGEEEPHISFWPFRADELAPLPSTIVVYVVQLQDAQGVWHTLCARDERDIAQRVVLNERRYPSLPGATGVRLLRRTTTVSDVEVVVG